MTAFTDIDKKAINVIRMLAVDQVASAQSGHPGAPMGCAPMAMVLFTRFMRYNPNNSKFFNRDRFVLSNGHACALQYAFLHVLGYKVTLNDLKNFRQLDSRTPGHPEVHHTDGIEVTTGPLGQGISNAVGMAIAAHHMAARFNQPNFNLIDNYVYCITGDGCLQEGVASEACSLAGHLGLGRLIVLYDANKIQIDGSTELAFSEDVLKRFEAYGWHTQLVADGDNDLAGMQDAVQKAKDVINKPSIILIKTTIGYGSKLQGTEKVHGSPLKADEIPELRKKFNLPEDKTFYVPDDVKEYFAYGKSYGEKMEKEWNDLFQKYKQTHKELGAELERRINGELPSGWKANLPKYDPSQGALATRKTSENVLNAIADLVPELVGGSADLTHSNLTRWKTAVDFEAKGRAGVSEGSYAGRYFRFGVREHGMSAILNGLAAYGGLIPFGATFLNFIGYAQGAFRLTALSHLQALYIMTHDSIGLGEDGPTHQPVEILALLRATPNSIILRPADGNETNGAYIVALEKRTAPSVLCLSRQNLPQLEGTSADKVKYGGYALKEISDPDVILVATGSEVSLIEEASRQSKLKCRVVSMPSWELFEEQSLEYRKSVFSAGVPVLSVEAYSTLGWERYAHASIGMPAFGASAPYQDVYKKLGFVPDNVAARAQQLVDFYKGKHVPHLLEKPF